MRPLLLAAALFGAAAPAAAQGIGQGLPQDPEADVSRVGTRGLNFLKLGVGARALALGGAYSATADGLTSVYWNAAGLADLQGLSGTLSYQDLYGNSGLSNGFVAVGAKLGSGAVALSFMRFSSGEIDRTTEQYPEGNDPLYGSTLEWTGTATQVTYARRITDRLAFGASAKMAQEGIDFANASWFGADFGTVFNTGLFASTIAISVNNLGGKARIAGSAVNKKIYNTGRDPNLPTGRDINTTLRTTENQMPVIFRFGLRTALLGASEALVAPNPKHNVTFLGEVVDAIDAPITPVTALEYNFQDRYFVRGAKKWIREDRAPFDFSDGLSAGLGVRLPAFGRMASLDYAVQTLDPLGTSQTFSVELGF